MIIRMNRPYKESTTSEFTDPKFLELNTALLSISGRYELVTPPSRKNLFGFLPPEPAEETGETKAAGGAGDASDDKEALPTAIELRVFEKPAKAADPGLRKRKGGGTSAPTHHATGHTKTS